MTEHLMTNIALVILVNRVRCNTDTQIKNIKTEDVIFTVTAHINMSSINRYPKYKLV